MRKVHELMAQSSILNMISFNIFQDLERYIMIYIYIYIKMARLDAFREFSLHGVAAEKSEQSMFLLLDHVGFRV